MPKIPDTQKEALLDHNRAARQALAMYVEELRYLRKAGADGEGGVELEGAILSGRKALTNLRGDVVLIEEDELL